MLTVDEAAKRAGVCRNTLRTWLKPHAEQLVHLRLGAPGSRGRILIDEKDLAAFLKNRKIGEPSIVAFDPCI